LVVFISLSFYILWFQAVTLTLTPNAHIVSNQTYTCLTLMLTPNRHHLSTYLDSSYSLVLWAAASTPAREGVCIRDTSMMAKAPKSPSLLLLLPSLHPSLQICTFHTRILTLWGVYMYPHRHAGTGSMGELSQNSLKLVFMYASTPIKTIW